MNKYSYLENNYFVKLFQSQQTLQAYSPRNPNGQDTMSDSTPVVVASDQSTVPVNDAAIENEVSQIRETRASENVAASDASGIKVGAVAETSPAAAVDSGDFVRLRADLNGRLFTSSVITVLPALAAGTNNIGDVDILSIAAGDNNIGNVDIVTMPDVTLAAGTNNIGDVDVLSIIPGTGATNLGKAIDTTTGSTDTGVLLLATRDDDLATLTPVDGDNVQLRTDSEGALWTTNKPTATEGVLTMNATSSDGATALTSTAQAIKASAGCLYGYYIYNPNATAQFVQFYNTASGSVTVGTTTPLFMLTIPPTSGANLFSNTGIQFSTAMSWAATSTAAGNGAPTTALDAVAWYK